MSVFRVNLNNGPGGNLDLDPSTDTSETYGQLGTEFATSRQRSVYVMGPGKVNRQLVDGATFTDCNYWKRFVSVTNGGTANENDAFLTIVSDDGSIYSDVTAENTFPRVWDLTLAGGSTYTDNEIDILGTYGGFAVFVPRQNTGSGGG